MCSPKMMPSQGITLPYYDLTPQHQQHHHHRRSPHETFCSVSTRPPFPHTIQQIKNRHRMVVSHYSRSVCIRNCWTVIIDPYYIDMTDFQWLGWWTCSFIFFVFVCFTAIQPSIPFMAWHRCEKCLLCITLLSFFGFSHLRLCTRIISYLLKVTLL